MTDAWLTVGLLTAATFAIRASGPIAVGGRELGRRAAAVIELLAPALLAALIIVETVGGPEGLDPDARIAGVAAAGLLLLTWRRSPMLATIALAALVTAGVRALS